MNPGIFCLRQVGSKQGKMKNKSEQLEVKKQIKKDKKSEKPQLTELSLNDQIELFAEIIIDQLLKEINNEKENA